MAYFANGTEGDSYMEQFCENCINWRDGRGGFGDGCPVWDIHLMYSYEECNNKEGNAKKMLDHLIPMTKDNIWANECRMFLRKTE